MPRRSIGAALAVVALWPAAAWAAGSSGVYNQVLHALQTDGYIPPCKFTSQALSTALSDVDTYGQQYYADVISAIQTALDERASGVCSGRHSLIAPPGHRLPPGAALPASVTSATSSGPPAPMLALAILAAVLAGATGAVTLVCRRGWLVEWRHGWAEARYRAEGLWAGSPRRRRGR